MLGSTGGGGVRCVAISFSPLQNRWYKIPKLNQRLQHIKPGILSLYSAKGSSDIYIVLEGALLAIAKATLLYCL